MKRNYKYFLTENLDAAIDGALTWFITHGCKWAGLHGRMPTREDIAETYSRLLQSIEERKVPWSETGDLRVHKDQFAVVRYGYKRELPVSIAVLS